MTKRGLISLFLTGVALYLALGVWAAFAGNLQKQVLGVTAQINGNCSATLISSERDKKSGAVETYFLTAKHCVTKNSLIDVDLPVYQNGRLVKKDRYIATVYSRHHSSDLALIVLRDTQTWFEHPAKIAGLASVPAMGDPVVTAGYPLGLNLTVTAGLFGALESIPFPRKEDGAETEYFRATPDIVGGNSGGAMYRIDENGNYELIGVTSAGHVAYPFIAFYTPLSDIHDFLRYRLPHTVDAKFASAS